MTAYPFLSESWIKAALKLRSRYEDRLPPPSAAFRLNVVVTDIPHRPGRLMGHVDTLGGQSIIAEGHLPEAETTVTLDYETARMAIIDNNIQKLMEAFFRGKILLEGDPSQLMMMQSSNLDPDPVALELHDNLVALTRDDE